MTPEELQELARAMEQVPGLKGVDFRDVRRLARLHMRGERRILTLQPTALVNELYLRLAELHAMAWRDRAHFFAVLARIMRQILVDYARRQHAAKRDAGIRLVLDEAIAPSPLRQVSVVVLDDVLQELSRLDSRQGQIVELRFFGGLSIEETALVLGVSPATVKREWSTARLWLRKQVAQPSPV